MSSVFTEPDGFEVVQEDDWTWMIRPEDDSVDFRIEVFNTGESYEVTLLERTDVDVLSDVEKHTVPEDRVQATVDFVAESVN